MNIQLPDYAQNIFQPKRYKVLYGGRGSSKSYTVADMLLILGRQTPIRVLCAREFQNSISESVHFLLKQEIDRLGFSDHYDVTQNTITGKNGTEFIFKGVRMNAQSIKSMTGLTHLWVEEAQTVSRTSWDILIPTIREPNSEIWITYNPDSPDDPVSEMFQNKDGSPKQLDNAIVLKINWRDNPWFPDVLKKEKDYLFSVNPELAEHVWEGKYKTHSDAQIFKNKYVVRDFKIDGNLHGPYFGADWGFATDPTTLVKVYLDYKNREVLVRNAKFGYGVELDHLPAMFDQIPDSRRYMIRGDSARPETISYIARKGFIIEGCEKWKGSVEDGIEWLKSFNKIVFHSDCDQEMIKEARNYSYKVDRLSGDVLTDVVDAYNHGWDAIRYAFQPIIKSGGLSILDVL